jgi:hypothetical protein
MSEPQRCISRRAGSPCWPTLQAPHAPGELRYR